MWGELGNPEARTRGQGERFQCSYLSSKMRAPSPTDIIPRTRQAIGKKKTMITSLFTGRKLTVLNILPKRSKFNQLYFVNYIFPDLEKQNVNSHRGIPQATFWVHMVNSMCHNGSEVTSKFEKHHVSRLPHPLCSPDMSPEDFWLFGIGMLKGVLKDHDFNSSDEIEEVTTKVWNRLTFDEVQGVFHNWMSRLAWVTENGGEYIIE
jgi:hypothetical protein